MTTYKQHVANKRITGIRLNNAAKDNKLAVAMPVALWFDQYTMKGNK